MSKTTGPWMTFPTLRTDRLVLRELRMSDSEALFSYRGLETGETFPRVGCHDSEGVTQRFIQRRLREYYTQISLTWVVCEQNADLAVGIVTIASMAKVTDSDPADMCRAEVSCSLHPRLRRKGIMSEARARIISHWFQSSKTHSLLHSEVATTNEPSLKMNAKLGFVPVVTLRNYERHDGKPYDIAILALHREAFLTHPIYAKYREV